MQVSMQVVRQALSLEALPFEALPFAALPLEALPLDVGGDSAATIAHLPRVASDNVVGSDASAGLFEPKRKTT
jgi:hypothetical protein